jgi:carbon monoxide dehydrogenase subunit G
MRIEGEYLFDGTREAVWERIRDPQVLASALPGTQSMQQISEAEYEGKMNVRIGPVAGVFAGRVVVSDETPPESATLTVEGRGAPGFVEGSGHVRLTEQGPNRTLLAYEGDLQVGGKLASVGQRLMDSVSKSIIRQGLESINALLQAPAAPAAEVTAPQPEMAARPGQQAPEPPPAFPPRQEPSQVQFAATVARDVARDYARDLLAGENQAMVLAIIGTLLGVLVGFWLGRISSGQDSR